MFYYCPHRTQVINGYLAQQAEEEHQQEEDENRAAWNELLVRKGSSAERTKERK
jgi:hypothetical protein